MSPSDRISQLVSRPWIKTAVLICVSFVLIAVVQLPYLRWVQSLSAQGTPAPALNADSPTGYEHQLRHFLGHHERGKTFRWIQRVQNLPEHGLRTEPHYTQDSLPEGRGEYAPHLYLWWLGLVASLIYGWGAASFGIAAEQLALWEPVILHASATSIALIALRHRLKWLPMSVVALAISGLPIFSGQFLPGVLGPRTVALLLAGVVLGRELLTPSNTPQRTGFHILQALLTAFCLWLDPGIGFPLLLLTTLTAWTRRATVNHWFHSLLGPLVGASMLALACGLDRIPWQASATEFRYVHPLYAVAWLGLGGLRLTPLFWSPANGGKRFWVMGALLAIAGLLPLFAVQIHHGFAGWAYPSTFMQRLTSLDETIVFPNLLAWLRHSQGAELLFILLPMLSAALMIGFACWKHDSKSTDTNPLPVAILLFALLLLSTFWVRWIVVLSALSILYLSLRFDSLWKRSPWVILTVLLVYGSGTLGWQYKNPGIWTRPHGDQAPGTQDVHALVYRSVAHWLYAQNPTVPRRVLAPPEASDFLSFHGNSQTLMSTAWESYPGQVAASRLLSAPESTEVEALIEATTLTHVILPSWDTVLPLLVREPAEADRDTLYDRLQRWVLPPVLRAIPYHLPDIPSFLDQKLAVFKAVDPQTEALGLSRLAEYFVEMRRDEPARLVAEALASTFPDNRDAVIARALVYKHLGQRVDFLNELATLVGDIANAMPATAWDRSVQRAIVLAHGSRLMLAKAELEDCIATAQTSDLLQLTPLQAHHMHALMQHHNLRFPSDDLNNLLRSLGSDYRK